MGRKTIKGAKIVVPKSGGKSLIRRDCLAILSYKKADANIKSEYPNSVESRISNEKRLEETQWDCSARAKYKISRHLENTKKTEIILGLLRKSI